MMLRQYQKMKDSGIEWIGKIPEHWIIEPMKFHVRINQSVIPESISQNFKISYIDISSVHSDGSIDEPETVFFKDAPSRARRIVSKGDTIVSTVRTYLRAISFIEQKNDNRICSTGFAVLSPRSQIYPKFMYYTISSEGYVHTIMANSYGVTYPAINSSLIGNFPCILLPLEEQKEIADFLDKETFKIDSDIQKNKKLIELLKEKRQTIINQAVTKGLDPTVPMKNSGLDWIGNIPEHWKKIRLKNVCDVRGRVGWKGYTVDDLVEDGALVIGAKHIQDSSLDLSDAEHISWKKYYESPEIMVKKNDLLIVQRGSLGKVVLIDYELGSATINPSILLITEFLEDAKFLWYQFQSLLIQNVVEAIRQSTAVPMISQEDVREFTLLLPKLEEQKIISRFLDLKTKQIDKVAKKLNDRINKLQEFRQTIVSSAVTGKIDVRQTQTIIQ